MLISSHETSQFLSILCLSDFYNMYAKYLLLFRSLSVSFYK